jgi:hypothetical protein
MNDYITAVNDDPFVKASTNGKGLRFQLLPGQKEKYIHQSHWRKICKALKQIDASPAHCRWTFVWRSRRLESGSVC